MSIRNVLVIASNATNFFRASRQRIWLRGLFLLAIGSAFMLSPSPAPSQTSGTPQAAASVVEPNVKLVIGGETVKSNSTGTLSVVGSLLEFATKKATLGVQASSILDISTNEDSRQDITGAGKIVTMAIPYGGGRVLSLFSHGVDVLTLEFTDSNGGYHGAVFVLLEGHAATIKRQLVAMGAKASVPLEEAAQTNK
jgi:hypothetical protein